MKFIRTGIWILVFASFAVVVSSCAKEYTEDSPLLLPEVEEVLSILEGASLQKLLEVARGQGFITLLEDGILKARSGVTTLTEVFRVCGANATTVDLSGDNEDA